jgi:hypothetical protein
LGLNHPVISGSIFLQIWQRAIAVGIQEKSLRKNKLPWQKQIFGDAKIFFQNLIFQLAISARYFYILNRFHLMFAGKFYLEKEPWIQFHAPQ